MITLSVAFVIASSCPGLDPETEFQGRGSSVYVTAGRASEVVKSKSESVRRQVEVKSTTARTARVSSQLQKNSEAVSKARDTSKPLPVVVREPTIIREYTSKTVGRVRIPVEDERGRPVSGLRVLVRPLGTASEGSQLGWSSVRVLLSLSPAPAWGFQEYVVENGSVVYPAINLPSAVEVRLPDSETEYSLNAPSVIIAALVPTSAAGNEDGIRVKSSSQGMLAHVDDLVRCLELSRDVTVANQIVLSKDGARLVLRAGETAGEYAGARITVSPVPSRDGGTWWLPLRLVVEKFGGTVEWSSGETKVEHRGKIISVHAETAKGVVPGSPVLIKRTTERRDGRQVIVEYYESTVNSPTETEPVRLRREIADVDIKKPSHFSTTELRAARFYLGEKLVEDVSHRSDSWRLRIHRDWLDDGVQPMSGDTNLARGSGDVVLQYETSYGRFGGQVELKGIDFYDLNEIEAPHLELEALPNNSITIAGRNPSSFFPISPLHWKEDSSNLRVITGDLLKRHLLRGSQESPAEITTETPNRHGRNERGRYGIWLRFPKLGIEARCRYDVGGKGSLPSEREGGLVEAIRITSREGGSVAGVLEVGASRDAIRGALGEPDQATIDVVRVLKLDEPNDYREKNLTKEEYVRLNVFGSKNIEYWDETYLSGGIRIKWDAKGHVRWFEIARPVQLLYSGSRAFISPLPKHVNIGEVQVVGANSPSLRATLENEIRQIITSIGGVTVTAANSADILINVRGTVNQNEEQKSRKLKRKDGTEYTEWYTLRSVSITCAVSFVDSFGEQIRFAEIPGLARGGRTGARPDFVWSTSRSSESDSFEAMEHSAVTSRTGGLLKRQDELYSGIYRGMALSSELLGTVIATNYGTGQFLINLGLEHNIKSPAPERYATEFSLYLLHEIDPETGFASRSARPYESFDLGTQRWAEAVQVGIGWSVVELKEKDALQRTRTNYGHVPLLLDGGSGLFRVALAQLHHAN